MIRLSICPEAYAAYMALAFVLGACFGVALGQLGNHLLSRDPKERHDRH